MKRMPDTAIKECVTELRAACRLPIEEAALETLVGWLRPLLEPVEESALSLFLNLTG